MIVAMTIMACVFSSCEEKTDFNSLNENGGINETSISEYEMENMLHDYYVQNNKSELVHRTMVWMSIHRRGAGYWNKVNEYVK